MVTDPNCFVLYAAMNTPPPPPPAPKDIPFTTEDEEGEEQEQQSAGDMSNPVIDNLKNLQENDTKDKNNYDDPASLANCLQSAAINKERQDAEIKAQRDAERQAEKTRIAEAQRQAAEEIRRREEEKIQLKKEQEEKILREEREWVESEENCQKAILAAQEAYWANQLKNNGDGGGGNRIGGMANIGGNDDILSSYLNVLN